MVVANIVVTIITLVVAVAVAEVVADVQVEVGMLLFRVTGLCLGIGGVVAFTSHPIALQRQMNKCRAAVIVARDALAPSPIRL